MKNTKTVKTNLLTCILTCFWVGFLFPLWGGVAGCGGERRISGNYVEDFKRERSGWVPEGPKSVTTTDGTWSQAQKDNLIATLFDWQRGETPRNDVSLLPEGSKSEAFFTFRKLPITDDGVLGYTDVQSNHATGEILHAIVTIRAGLSEPIDGYATTHEAGHAFGLGHASGLRKYISVMSPQPTYFAPTKAQRKPGKADLETLEAWNQIGDDPKRRNDLLDYWAVTNQLHERIGWTRYTLKTSGECNCGRVKK
jgi:hypothetical protein